MDSAAGIGNLKISLWDSVRGQNAAYIGSQGQVDVQQSFPIRVERDVHP